jgi:catechol 2,3-dioxygenase-like lactoylglutathione lyase family enzyme
VDDQEKGSEQMMIKLHAALLVAAAALATTPCLAADAPPVKANATPPAPFIREGTLNQNPTIGKLRGRILRVKRPLLMVHDLERSIHFYVDLVGLELYDIEPAYDTNPESLGYPMFNIDAGARKRMASLNTSDEVRGVTLEELLDMDWTVQQKPRTSTILFETDDLLGIISRVKAAGYTVIPPVAGEIPARLGVPALRFMEGGVVDPDGHVVAFFQNYADDAEWQRIREQYR